MAARDDALRAPAQPDHRRAGHPADFLAAHRIGFGGKFPRGRRSRAGSCVIFFPARWCSSCFSPRFFRRCRSSKTGAMVSCRECWSRRSPARRSCFGKCLGGMTLAAAQAALFCLAAPWAGLPFDGAVVLRLLAALLLGGFALTALGFHHRLAARIDAGLPRHDEPGAHSALVALGCLFPGAGRHVDGMGRACAESAGLCHRGVCGGRSTVTLPTSAWCRSYGAAMTVTLHVFAVRHVPARLAGGPAGRAGVPER